MYRKDHRVWYYPWFQASARSLGNISPADKGYRCTQKAGHLYCHICSKALSDYCIDDSCGIACCSFFFFFSMSFLAC